MAQSALYQRYSTYYQRASALYQRPQIKASLEIIMSVFVVTLLTLLAIRPTLTNVVQLQKKIEDQEVVLKKTDVKLGQLIKAEGQLTENPRQIGLLSEAVPDRFVYFDISKRIEIIARESQVKWEQLKLPGTVIQGERILDTGQTTTIIRPDEAGSLVMPVSFTVEGNQEQVVSFLRSIANLDRFAVIKNVKITKEQGVGIGAPSTLRL